MAGVENIPLAFVVQLLPSPDISVRQFLSFVLPLQLGETIGINNIEYSGKFWSKIPLEPIDTSYIATLIQLPIPSQSMLNVIAQEHAQALSNGYSKIKSITYAHLPATNPASKTNFQNGSSSIGLRSLIYANLFEPRG